MIILNMSNLFDVVVFHYPCQDGLASAWVTYNYHKENNINIELYPIQHGTTLDISRLENKKVLFCDYSPSIEMLDKIETVVSSLCILDHHISAQRALENKSYAIFDMNRSGVGITWGYFYPTTKLPYILECIQDRDLFAWKVENSRDITAAIYLLQSTKEQYNFNELFTVLEHSDGEYLLNLGKIINKSNMMKSENIAELHATRANYYMEYKYCIVNCSSDFASDVGNILTTKYGFDFAVLWNYFHPTEDFRVSLRANNMIDVSLLAKKFGGGGHKNASGFNTKINPVILFMNL